MIGKLVQDIEGTTMHKHRNIVYTKKTNMWSARLKSSIQSINYINKNYSPTYTCVCVCVCVCVWKEREKKKKRKRCPPTQFAMWKTYWEHYKIKQTLSMWPTMCKVLNSVDKRCINPYKRLFLRHNCLMLSHTLSPLPPKY